MSSADAGVAREAVSPAPPTRDAGAELALEPNEPQPDEHQPDTPPLEAAGAGHSVDAGARPEPDPELEPRPDEREGACLPILGDCKTKVEVCFEDYVFGTLCCGPDGCRQGLTDEIVCEENLAVGGLCCGPEGCAEAEELRCRVESLQGRRLCWARVGERWQLLGGLPSKSGA